MDTLGNLEKDSFEFRRGDLEVTKNKFETYDIFIKCQSTNTFITIYRKELDDYRQTKMELLFWHKFKEFFPIFSLVKFS